MCTCDACCMIPKEFEESAFRDWTDYLHFEGASMVLVVYVQDEFMTKTQREYHTLI